MGKGSGDTVFGLLLVLAPLFYYVVLPVLFVLPTIMVSFSRRAAGTRKLLWIGITVAATLLPSAYAVYGYFSSVSPRNLTRPQDFTVLQWALIIFGNLRSVALGWIALMVFLILNKKQPVLMTSVNLDQQKPNP